MTYEAKSFTEVQAIADKIKQIIQENVGKDIHVIRLSQGDPEGPRPR